MINIISDSFILDKETMALLTCESDICFSWVLVLVNVLTIFFMAYWACSLISRKAKVFGWIWLVFIVVTGVMVILLHICIYSIIGAAFTLIVSICCFSILLNAKVYSEKGEDKSVKGYYLISQTSDKMYVFRLYDNHKKELLISCYKYLTLESVKRAIEDIKKSSIDIKLEDRSSSWMRALDAPKLLIDESGKKYVNKLLLSDEYTAFTSKKYDKSSECVKMMEKVKKALLTKEIFMSREILDGKPFISFEKKD